MPKSVQIYYGRGSHNDDGSGDSRGDVDSESQSQELVYR